ncbi:MAG: hypothetical protein EOM25_11975 [Deltaproteobacteria bacterium]|nr:hypothetical protein [Deltaproteobacteria bacterium]
MFVGLVSMGLVLLLGRILGPEAFGTYNYALTLGAFWAVALDAGYSVLIFRETTSPSLVSRTSTLYHAALGHLAWALALGLAGAALLPGPGLVPAIVCFGVLQISRLVSAGLKGKGRFEAEALWQAGIRAGSALIIGAVVLAGYREPGWIFSAWATGAALVLFLSPWSREILAKPDPWPSGRLLRAGMPLMIIELSTLLYFRLDMVVIEGVLGAGAVGLYAAAHRLVEGVVLPLAPLTQIWFRDLRLAAKSNAGFGRAMTWRVLVLAGFSLLPAGILFWGANPIIFLLYGPEYEDSAQILAWIAPSLIFIFPNAMLTQACLAVDQERAYAIMACLAGVCNLGLNLVFLPGMGAKGAALATVITEAVLGLGLLLTLMRARRIPSR